jgi:glycine cleavage system transcriptional repressor
VNKESKKNQFIQITSICDINECVALEIAQNSDKLELNVKSMRKITDGGKSICLFTLSGAWHCINKMELFLKKIKKSSSENILSFNISDYDSTDDEDYIINYHLNIVAATDDNLLYELQNFLIVNEIKLDHFTFDNYKGCPNQIPLIVVNAKISIQKDISLSDLRERFIIFCDSLNVDGVLDPIRPI